MQRIPLFLLLFLLSGCIINRGPKLEDFRSATSDSGPSVELEVTRNENTSKTFEVQGQLVAADDHGLLLYFLQAVHLKASVQRIPYQRIERARFDDLHYLNLGQDRSLSESKKEQYRLISRFPGGPESAAFQKFLASIGQEEVDIIEYIP